MHTSPSRRTFSGRGRPRKAGAREANGQLQRQSRPETRAEIIAVAVAQPHRRGSDDPRRRWPIGRLILDGKVRLDGERLPPSRAEETANRYAADYRRYQRALASKRVFAVGSGGSGEDMTPRQVEAAIDAWLAAGRALRHDLGHIVGERVEAALSAAILHAPPDHDERSLAPWIVLSLGDGLMTLGEHYGLTS
jgi:hypothetical protein